MDNVDTTPPQQSVIGQQSPVVCWCYTSYLVDQTPIVPDSYCKYRIEGREICPTTGRAHIQGYVQFKSKQRFTALQKFCKQANWIKANGSPWQNFEYCSKDGDFTEHGERPKAPKEKDTTYPDALAASTVREGLEIIKRQRARDFCLHGESIERNLKRAKTPVFKHMYTNFVRGCLPFNGKSILLYGPTKLGKTHFGCYHFKAPFVVTHIDQLKTFSADYDGIVFDDMSFRHWPVEAIIHLLDFEFERTINVRYGTVVIPAGTKKIFTHNNFNPFYKDEDVEEDQREAIERRIERVHVLNKLYL